MTKKPLLLDELPTEITAEVEVSVGCRPNNHPSYHPTITPMPPSRFWPSTMFRRYAWTRRGLSGEQMVRAAPC